MWQLTPNPKLCLHMMIFFKFSIFFQKHAIPFPKKEKKQQNILESNFFG
jgi:hypothetical protein